MLKKTVLAIAVLFLSAGLLSTEGCSGKKEKARSEDFIFLDSYVVDNDDQAIDFALKQGASLQEITSGLLAAYRNLEMLTVFQKYNTRVNMDLEAAFAEYRDFLEGPFFYYYSALLNLEEGNRTEAIQNISGFLRHYHKKDALRSLGQHYLALLTNKMTLAKFWSDNKQQQKNRTLLIASVQALDRPALLKLLNGVQATDHSLSGLLKRVEQGDIGAWRIYRGNRDLFKPMYKEKIILKQQGKSSQNNLSLIKPFYYPYEYDVLVMLYKMILKHLTAAYLSLNPQQISAQMKPAEATPFFYYNLHLSDMFKFGLNRQSQLWIKQLSKMARTPLQKNLAGMNKKILAARLSAQKQINPQQLSPGYVPIVSAIFRAYQFRNMAEAGLPVSRQLIEQCKADLYKYAPDDNYNLHGLGLLGETYLEQQKWKEAKTYLNYLVQNGYALQANDAINLSKLALAIYNERSQISSCNWILKELRKKYNYVNPLLENTKFIVSAKFSK